MVVSASVKGNFLGLWVVSRELLLVMFLHGVSPKVSFTDVVLPAGEEVPLRLEVKEVPVRLEGEEVPVRLEGEEAVVFLAGVEGVARGVSKEFSDWFALSRALFFLYL